MRVYLARLIAILCVALGLSLTQPCIADENHTLVVVVSSKPAFAVINKLNAQELSLIYWCKKQFWEGGVRIHPINLQAEHPLRHYFSKAVLGSSPGEQSSYWNGLYFHGITPPYSVQSEEAVLRYIANTKGAIGYVDACNIDDRVKGILWITNDKISTATPEKLSCPNVQ